MPTGKFEALISALKYIGQKSFKFFGWYFGKLITV
jgi:hypothetical protein